MQDPFWLSPDEKELDLDNGLVSALTQAMAANTTSRAKGALQDWLCGCKSMNKRELVGISRHMVPSTFERPCCLRVASWVLKCVFAIVRSSVCPMVYACVLMCMHLSLEQSLVCLQVAMRAASSPTSMTLCLAFVQCVSRLNLHLTQERIVRAGLQNWIDGTMCAAYASMDKSVFR